jgi:hypothetical protein
MNKLTAMPTVVMQMVLNAAQVKNSEYENFQTGDSTVEETDNSSCKHIKGTNYKKPIAKVWITIIMIQISVLLCTHNPLLVKVTPDIEYHN